MEECKEFATVFFYDASEEETKKFVVNKDGTISPLKAQNLVIGMIATDGSV